MSLVFACGGGSDSEPEIPIEPPPPPLTRSFKMGFTPWVFDATLAAFDTTYTRLSTHGDIIKHHLEGGIPWQEDLDSTDYHDNVEAEINDRLTRTAVGMDIFLAIDAINSGRDSLTDNWSENTGEARSGDWVDRSWGSPEVITAYTNFAIDMINRFQPTHFEYGTEASELLLNDPVGFAEFVIFANAVYTSLSALYPDLKLMTSVSLKTPGNAEMQLIEAGFSPLMAFTDVLGISVYPYAFFEHADKGDPANLPSNWLTQASNIAGSKPMAISETGWIAEDLEISDFQYSETSDSTKQYLYLLELLEDSQVENMEFVIWWTVTDFDELWNGLLAQDPTAKIWKDIGLYDENQQPRDALNLWDEWLGYDYQSD